jgi:phage shock protein C
MSTTATKDNLLGVCNAIGEDFGFNPLWLRLPLAATIMVSPMWTLIAYAAMGLAVAVSRIFVRSPRAAKADPATAPIAAHSGDHAELALAA